MKPTIKRLSVASAAAAAILLGGTVAAQATGDGGDVIHGCAGNDYIRLATTAKPCKPNETVLDWNKEGPQGVPGTPRCSGCAWRSSDHPAGVRLVGIDGHLKR